VKRFLCEVTTDKKVSFISEGEGSYMDVVSTAYRPNVRIVYNKLLKETKNLPDNEVNIADFIDVKGMKAQGNQLTKLKVKEIVLTHEIEGGEPWPEDVQVEGPELEHDEESGADTEEESEGADGTTIEWDLTKKTEDDDEEDGQITLF
jgi:topoisomerase-4 subunit A